MVKIFRRFVGCVGSALMALLLLCALAPVSVAYAEDEDGPNNGSSGNYVNERQLPDGSFIYDTSIEELAEADAYFDGQTVVITGEVVGDCISNPLDSSGCWITLYSLKQSGDKVYNPSSIQVRVSKALADSIDTYGEYGVRGSIVQVRGTFNLACKDHEGVSDVHAQQLTVTSPGVKTEATVDVMDFVPGAIAVVVGLFIMLIYHRIVERRR